VAKRGVGPNPAPSARWMCPRRVTLRGTGGPSPNPKGARKSSGISSSHKRVTDAVADSARMEDPARMTEESNQDGRSDPSGLSSISSLCVRVFWIALNYDHADVVGNRAAIREVLHNGEEHHERGMSGVLFSASQCHG